MTLVRSAYAPLHILAALIFFVAGGIASVSDVRAQSVSEDSDSAAEGEADPDFVPGSFDKGEPSGAFIDFAPPPVPTYNISASRRTETTSKESPDLDPAAKKLRQEETLGRVHTKDGSIGLETDRRGDPSKVVPLNDFSQNQSRKPDSFIGFSIVQPYDSK